MGQSKHSHKLEGHLCPCTPVGSESVRRGDVSQSLGGGLDMIQQLPVEVLRSIYEFDATYHDIYKTVVREVKTIGELSDIFNGSVTDVLDILEQPSLVREYAKKDFERYARFLGILNSRKLTRRRLLAKLVCHHLRERHVYELDINSLWVLS